MTEFTHINQQGHAKMVDVSDKQITKRTAVAHSSITVNETIFKQISNNTNTKGNVLNTAQIAGIMAAKNTSTIIPMCHPLPLTGIDVHFSWDETNAPLYTLNIQTTVSTTGKTGVGVILSKSAPTTLAVTLANDLNITAVGFIRNGGFNIYSHPERIIDSEQ
ncbi:TPA: cyclic pyranopterin monophosphate synthase MoaC [Staphylococcus aureus]